MSKLHEILVIGHRDDRERIGELSFWLTEQDKYAVKGAGTVGNVLPIDQEWGGFKQSVSEVWAGVVDHFDPVAFLDWAARVPWSEPGSTQILIHYEEDTFFQLYMWRDGRFEQITPPSDTW